MDVNIEDPSSLFPYLQSQGLIEPGERPLHHRLDGGVSNRTVRLQRATGIVWVFKQALARLRVATVWESDPARIHREALALRELHSLIPKGPFPRFVFEDFDQHVLGMSAIPDPHRNWKLELLEGRVDFDLVGQFAELLAQLHRTSQQKFSRLPSEFFDTSYFESLRLAPYYQYSAQQNSQATPFLEALIQETRRHRLALVHGDYSPKNTLVANGRLYLLDFEVMHCGDPAFDIGFALTHLLSKANHLPVWRASFVEASRLFWSVYCENGGFCDSDFEARAVRHTLACLLARVDGRSPLEYLSSEARVRQRSAAIHFLSNPPQKIPELIDLFIHRLSS